MTVEFSSPIPCRTAPKGRDKNLPGDKYGRLTLVDEVAGQSCSPSNRKWAVRCDCGEVSQVELSGMRKGNSRSCGCYQREVAAERGRASATHGLSLHPLRDTHMGMMRRCYNPKNKAFAYYGARGIQVCERWHDILNFVEDMSQTYHPGLSLERTNNSLGYSPENCVWATKVAQARNTRSNRLVSYLGKNLCLKEACEVAGLNYSTVQDRIRRGWPLSKSLESHDFQEPGA